MAMSGWLKSQRDKFVSVLKLFIIAVCIHMTSYAADWISDLGGVSRLMNHVISLVSISLGVLVPWKLLYRKNA